MATCKKCREFEKCKDDAFINGTKFDPNESAKYCTGFEPITNADRIRAMSDEELARFLADKIEKEYILSQKRLGYSEYTPTATQIEAIRHNYYCIWMKWLKQPAEEEE